MADESTSAPARPEGERLGRLAVIRYVHRDRAGHDLGAHAASASLTAPSSVRSHLRSRSRSSHATRRARRRQTAVPSAAHVIPGRSEWCRPISAPIAPRRAIQSADDWVHNRSDDADRVPHWGDRLTVSIDSCVTVRVQATGAPSTRNGPADDQALPPGFCCSEAGRLLLGTTSNIAAFLCQLPALAKDMGCLASTDEGLEDAAATSPRRVVLVAMRR